MRHLHALFVGLFTAMLFAFSLTCAASDVPDPRGIVVVMNADIELSSINDEELIRLYTGKSSRLPNGERAALAGYASESEFFNDRLLGISEAKLASIWSRLKFSGRATPPRLFDNVEALVSYVATTPNALAYMPASAPRLGVRVVTTLPR